METSFRWLRLLVGLSLSGILAQSASAFPQPRGPHASHQEPRLAPGQSSGRGAPAGELRTVGVTCHPDSMEVVIEADMFGVGSPVGDGELRLGVEDRDPCKAAATPSGDEYRIVAGLMDCGAKRRVTEDAVVYANLLVFSPAASPYGLIRMDEAAVPLECRYQRRYRVSSSPLTPTWVPSASAHAAAQTLQFDLRVMTGDWRYRRSSGAFHLGESVSVEASVSLGHHAGLRVFMDDCVATRHADAHSVPRYVFIRHGCLIDSQISGSRSHFLPRTQEHKLQLVIDAFRFHNEDVGQLYITCQLNAVPVSYAEAPNKACTFANKRWQSADDNNYLCRYCQSQAGQTLSKSGPRGLGRPEEPEALWRSGLKTNVWEQEARVGPLLVSPGGHRSGPLPGAEHAPVLNRLGRLLPYGSQWRSGVIDRTDVEKAPFAGSPSTPDGVEEAGDKRGTAINDLEKGLLPGPPSAPDVDENDDKSGTDTKDLEKARLPGSPPELEEDNDEEDDAAPLDQTVLDVTQKADPDNAADLGDVGLTTRVKLDVTLRPNATTTESGLSDTSDPKR